MPDAAVTPRANIFVARQPILDRDKKVVAYELLFRDGLDNFFPASVSSEQATSKVISTSFLMLGLATVTDGRKAFINFPEELLLAGAPLLCDKKSTVIEILEDVAVTADLLAACARLREEGFTLALDDFLYTPDKRPLMELAQIIKFDLMQMTREELAKQAAAARSMNLRLLAEKVETIDEFDFTRALGFEYFQGYFFSRPNIIAGHDIPTGKLQLLRIFQQLNDPNFDFEKLGRLISHDVSLSYKLLKYVNSAWLGLRHKVRSLKGAAAILGEDALRRWLALVTMSSIAADKPSVLTQEAILRAVFCEKAAQAATSSGLDSGSCYAIGLFSLLDAMLDRPMEVIVAELSLDDSISAALLGVETPVRLPLAVCLAWQRGDWAAVAALRERLGIYEDALPGIYQTALATVRQFEDIL